MAYETLFTPTQLGSLSIPNRVIMAPLTRARMPDSVPGQIQEAYYGQRAGAGLIISEATNTPPLPVATCTRQASGPTSRKRAGKGLLMLCMPKAVAWRYSCGTLVAFHTRWFNLTVNSPLPRAP